jgi:hypothetical protein
VKDRTELMLAITITTALAVFSIGLFFPQYGDEACITGGFVVTVVGLMLMRYE